MITLSGGVPAYFYEPVDDFDTVLLMARLNRVLKTAGEPSYPSATVGFKYHESSYYSVTGKLALPTATDPYRGRHMVAVVDHDDVSEIKFWNTWGPPWGDEGFGYLSREYFEECVDSAYVSWSAQGGPSMAFTGCMQGIDPVALPSAEERFAHCWSTPNTFGEHTFELNGKPHTLLMWQVASLGLRYVIVTELRNAEQVIGRSHLYLEEDRGSLRELFVRPELRRLGYGSFLEGLATMHCREYEYGELAIWLHEADALQRGSGARAFGAARGYVWRDVEARLPTIVAVGTKET